METWQTLEARGAKETHRPQEPVCSHIWERGFVVVTVPIVWLHIQFGPTEYNGAEGLQAQRTRCESPS